MSLTRGSTGRVSSSATRLRSSDMPVGLGCQFEQRQRLRRPQVDRIAPYGAEHLAIEDHVRILALDRDFVRFLEVHAWDCSTAKLADDFCEYRSHDRFRLSLDGKHLELAFTMRAKVGRQQKLLECRDGEKRKAAADRITLLD